MEATVREIKIYASAPFCAMDLLDTAVPTAIKAVSAIGPEAALAMISRRAPELAR